MDNILLASLGVLFTYCIAPLVLFLGVARFLNLEKKDSAITFFLLLGAAPMSISWLIRWLISYFPGRQDSFYLAVVGFFYLCVLLFSYKRLYLFSNVWTQCVAAFDTKKNIWSAIYVLFFGMCLLFCLSLYSWWAISQPITGNDPLQYATVARFIYEYKAVDIYPFITAEPHTGFYAPSSHPLGFPSLMVWSYMLQGGTEHTLLLRVISPFFAVCTCLALVLVLSRVNRYVAVIGPLILVTTPLYMLMVQASHIDSMRIYTFFMAMVWLAISLDKKNIRFAAVAGVFIGLSLFSHSIGLLSLPFSIAITVLFPGVNVRRKLSILLVVCTVALIVGGARYVSNYADKGALLSDSVDVLLLPELDHREHIRETRGLDSFGSRLCFGVLKGFSNVEHFGLSYWLLVGATAMFMLRKKLRKEKLYTAMGDPFLFSIGCTFLFFYSLVLLTFFIGSDSFIKNGRYMLTIQPFIAYLAAIVIGRVNES